LLTIMASQRINFPATFTTSDVNFDGYLDFSVLAEFGGTFGAPRGVTLRDASAAPIRNAITAARMARRMSRFFHALLC